jgi:membrane-associated phospholipid phosphatase
VSGEPPTTRTRFADGTRTDRSRRRVTLLVLVTSLAAFAPFAVKSWKKDFFAWDWELSSRLHALENRETAWNRHVDVFDVVLNPFFQALGLLVLAAVVVALVRRGNTASVAFVVLGVGGTAALAVLLKHLFERPSLDDPSGGGDSFPSGHAMRSFAAAVVVAVVAWPTRWRIPLTVVGAVVAALIGTAVVYHEWHWATDVLAGWFISTAWIACIWLALDLPVRRTSACEPIR